MLYGTTDPSCRLLGAEVGVGVRCLCGGGVMMAVPCWLVGLQSAERAIGFDPNCSCGFSVGWGRDCALL